MSNDKLFLFSSLFLKLFTWSMTYGNASSETVNLYIPYYVRK